MGKGLTSTRLDPAAAFLLFEPAYRLNGRICSTKAYLAYQGERAESSPCMRCRELRLKASSLRPLLLRTTARAGVLPSANAKGSFIEGLRPYTIFNSSMSVRRLVPRRRSDL